VRRFCRPDVLLILFYAPRDFSGSNPTEPLSLVIVKPAAPTRRCELHRGGELVGPEARTSRVLDKCLDGFGQEGRHFQRPGGVEAREVGPRFPVGVSLFKIRNRWIVSDMPGILMGRRDAVPRVESTRLEMPSFTSRLQLTRSPLRAASARRGPQLERAPAARLDGVGHKSVLLAKGTRENLFFCLCPLLYPGFFSRPVYPSCRKILCPPGPVTMSAT
jgi:hypothetical protein